MLSRQSRKELPTDSFGSRFSEDDFRGFFSLFHREIPRTVLSIFGGRSRKEFAAMPREYRSGRY